jgi:hypothetical protein
MVGFPMSVINLEIRLHEIPMALEAFRKNRKLALDAFTDDLRDVAGRALDHLLKAEINIFLGQSDQSDNKRNGYHPER